MLVLNLLCTEDEHELLLLLLWRGHAEVYRLYSPGSSKQLFFLIKKIGLLMYFLCARTHTYIYKGTQVQTWYNMHMCQVHR